MLSGTWNRDGTRIVTAGGDHSARVWDAETGSAVAILQGHSEAILHANWSADQRRIVTASGDGTVRQWFVEIEDLATAACRHVPRNMTTDEWQRYVGDEPYRPTCPNIAPATG